MANVIHSKATASTSDAFFQYPESTFHHFQIEFYLCALLTKFHFIYVNFHLRSAQKLIHVRSFASLPRPSFKPADDFLRRTHMLVTVAFAPMLAHVLHHFCIHYTRLFNGIFYRNHQNGYLWLMVALFLYRIVVHACLPAHDIFRWSPPPLSAAPQNIGSECECMCVCEWVCWWDKSKTHVIPFPLRIIFDFDVVDFQQTLAITPFRTVTDCVSFPSAGQYFTTAVTPGISYWFKWTVKKRIHQTTITKIISNKLWCT